MKTIRIDYALLRRLSTSKNAISLTRPMAEMLGLTWPMRDGWVKEIIETHRYITQEQFDKIDNLRSKRRAAMEASWAKKGLYGYGEKNREEPTNKQFHNKPIPKDPLEEKMKFTESFKQSDFIIGS